jgi:hypothetical protein
MNKYMSEKIKEIENLVELMKLAKTDSQVYDLAIRVQGLTQNIEHECRTWRY